MARSGSEKRTEQIAKELLMAEGDRMLRTATSQLLDRAGGLLGALAGIFLDEDKLNDKVQAVLIEHGD